MFKKSEITGAIAIVLTLGMIAFAGTTNFDDVASDTATIGTATISTGAITTLTVGGTQVRGIVPLTFAITNLVTGESTGEATSLTGLTSYKMPYAGSILGLSYKLNAVSGIISPGSNMTVEAYCQSVATGLKIECLTNVATATAYTGSTTQVVGLDTFTAGSTIEARITINAAFNPMSTVDATATVWVTQ